MSSRAGEVKGTSKILTELNDAGLTFQELADVIEAHYLKL